MASDGAAQIVMLKHDLWNFANPGTCVGGKTRRHEDTKGWSSLCDLKGALRWADAPYGLGKIQAPWPVAERDVGGDRESATGGKLEGV